MRWLLLLCLAVTVNAQSNELVRWVGVGRLTTDVVMYYSIRVEEAQQYLDAAVLIKLDEHSSRSQPDGYYPDGGAQLGSHSIFYDELSRTVWADGVLLLRLNGANVALLREASAPGQQPKIIHVISAARPIPHEGAVMTEDIRELLLSEQEVRAYVSSNAAER